MGVLQLSCEGVVLFLLLCEVSGRLVSGGWLSCVGW